jgi:hypothetical protein
MTEGKYDRQEINIANLFTNFHDFNIQKTPSPTG